MDWILQSLDRTSVVPIVISLGRHRFVGLFDVTQELFEQLLLELASVAHDHCGVFVLRLEVSDYLRIVSISQPVPLIDPLVAMGRGGVRTSGRLWRNRTGWK